MNDASIARNYAEALLALAAKAKDQTGYGALIRALGDAVSGNRTLQQFLAAPQVSAAEKHSVLSKALEGRAPRAFILFVQKLVTNRRQTLVPDIATEYHALLDAAEGRVHARVTVARPYDAAATAQLAQALSTALATTVVPHVTVDERIIGGIVVRVGDTVMDGSIQRRLEKLRTVLVGQG